jgi:Domain of unknown function (DUF397)
MSTVDVSGAVWRKSSYSGNGNNDNCIEVAFAGPMIAVRDSKNPAAGVLALHSTGWRSFLRTIG